MQTDSQASDSATDQRHLECPHCGATLRKVESGADGKVLCLNCNKRFATNQSSQRLDLFVTDSVCTREPDTPTYGYLRIAGVLLLLAGIAGTLLLGYGWYEEINSLSRTMHPGHYWWLSTSLLPVALGGALFTLSSLIPKLDTLHTIWAWRQGLLAEPLDSPKGSALPYVLPVAACGGVAGVAMLMASFLQEEAVMVVLAVCGVAVVVMALTFAFALENLRLFLWRQRELARRTKSRKVGTNNFRLPWWPWYLRFEIATMLAGGFLSIGILSEWNAGGLITFLICSGCLASSVSFALLLHHQRNAAAAWQQAAERTMPGRRGRIFMTLRALTFLLALTAAVLCCAYWFDSYRNSNGNLIVLGTCLGLPALVLTMVALAGSAADWLETQACLLGSDAQPRRTLTWLAGLCLTLSILNFAFGIWTMQEVLEVEFRGAWRSGVRETVLIGSLILLGVLASAILPLWLAVILRTTQAARNNATATVRPEEHSG